MANFAELNTLGIFDSGQGGLGTWNRVRQTFPHLSTVYLGDNARYPFGTKSNQTVRRYSTEALLCLAAHGADAVVVACGTASCVAVPALSSVFKMPVLGIVDGMCAHAARALDTFAAVESSKSIAVLGTPYSISSGRIDSILRPEIQKSEKTFLWKKACPLFVPLVEEGLNNHTLTAQAIEHYLSDIPSSTRVVMLACTHFPHLIPQLKIHLEKRFEKEVKVYQGSSGSQDDNDCVYLVDPAIAITETLKSELGLHTAKTSQTSRHKIFCTDDAKGFVATAQRFSDVPLPTVEQINL